MKTRRSQQDDKQLSTLSPYQRMVIQGDGKVGIGTASPSYQLDVNGDINFSGNLYQGGSLFGSPWTKVGSNVYLSAGYVGIGLTNPAYNLEVTGTAKVSSTLDVGGRVMLGTSSYLSFSKQRRHQDKVARRWYVQNWSLDERHRVHVCKCSQILRRWNTFHHDDWRRSPRHWSQPFSHNKS